MPPKEKFYSLLNESEISDEYDYHASRVWDEFEKENAGQYTDLHVKTDILLLDYALEALGKNCFETYGLDCPWTFMGCNTEAHQS